MRKIILCLCFALLSITIINGQTTEEINVYNNAINGKNYEKALQLVEGFLKKNPSNFDLYRERIKLLAATGNDSEFLEALGVLRNSNHPDSLNAIFDAIKHPMVTKKQRDLAYDFFRVRKDDFVTNGWPVEKPLTANLGTRDKKSKKTNNSKETAPTKKSDSKSTENNSKDSSNGESGLITPTNLLIGFVLFLVLSAYLSLPTCPKCGSKKCTKIETIEKDRFLGAKAVAVKNGKGEKIGETSITVTYALYLHTYQCNSCSTQFLVEEKKELG